MFFTMPHNKRIIHWLAHAFETALIAGLLSFSLTRELGGVPLAALGAAGGAFMTVLMGFAAYLSATGAVRPPDPPAQG
ncbi:hypothetical protein MF672_040710 [Actinomadura sp. ATCC 31491]|uniref:Uncharacterized protein n=1 Tax=Actinomadura luzonensis TaxID=2805427 RepID=A0ABT0G630_9ACTN|nr:hypothetical protein [Actinomadura luzonensis]MCK2220076.1 hypothetical protein [Actinomadura luzonensis]